MATKPNAPPLDEDPDAADERGGKVSARLKRTIRARKAKEKKKVEQETKEVEMREKDGVDKNAPTRRTQMKGHFMVMCDAYFDVCFEQGRDEMLAAMQSQMQMFVTQNVDRKAWSVGRRAFYFPDANVLIVPPPGSAVPVAVGFHE
jgi:hypothetical protein